ncbi:putative GATA transcription factor 22 [Platanthera guangdongensis]|uniref:GATA transcription factor 22 n=1 Tax=Platanthera guangdongensis TaxID=2320717 RepID=A0ABR2LLV6_9ASPA
MLPGDGNAAVRRKRSNAGECGEEKTVAALEVPVKLCSDCRSSDTPLWRSGPNGPKSLCNACGIRYSKMRKLEFKKVKARKPEAGSCRIDGKSDAAEAAVDMEELKRRQREKQEKMLEVLLRRRREMNLRRSKFPPANTGGGGGDCEEVAAAARLLLSLSSGISLRS